jgi:hypothetical protein
MGISLGHGGSDSASESGIHHENELGVRSSVPLIAKIRDEWGTGRGDARA